MGLYLGGKSCELREVVLRDKPQAMLDLSPKGTVPVLLLPDGRVIEESFDIMLWALGNDACLPGTKELVQENDGSFKMALDKYKYAQGPAEEHRTEGEIFLKKLDDILAQHKFLLGGEASFVDIAIFPFIRQFAHVDKDWFWATPYANLIRWLDFHLESPLFNAVMTRYAQWHPDQDVTYFGPPDI